jgi:hypothetical protein
MASRRRSLCADVSRDNSEPLAATASRIDHWLLIEYRGLWGREPLRGSGLSDEVRKHVRVQLAARVPARLLFVKRPERRGRGGIRVYHGSTRAQNERFFRRELESYDELLDLDLSSSGGEPLEQPLFVVCTHGKRDRCCAVYGRPLYEALRDQLDEDWVWQATHVGGDRFAGNLVVFPQGLYFGRVGPNDVRHLLDAYFARRVDLEHYRGRCSYPFPVQAAEYALREELGVTGIDGLSLARVARGSESWTVAFRSEDGSLYERTVVAELGEPAYLTCDAETLRRPRRFRVRSQP